MRKCAALNRCPLEREEPILHDLDWLASWTASPLPLVDCGKVLAAWNLFADVAISVEKGGLAFKHIDSQLPKTIYEKLFWGSNLPSMTPEGAHYDPGWSLDEIHSLAEILGSGLQMLKSCTRPWPHQPSG